VVDLPEARMSGREGRGGSTRRLHYRASCASNDPKTEAQRSASTAKAIRRRSRSSFHIPAWEFRHMHYESRAERPGCDLVQVAAPCWSGYARARLAPRLLGLVVVALGLALVGQAAARSRAALRRNAQDPTIGRHPDEPGPRSTEDHWLPRGPGRWRGRS
jgi:hypothetical protein